MLNGFLKHLLFTAICFECILSSAWGITNPPLAMTSPFNCTAVTHLLEARGFQLADIPMDPTKETYHRFCDLPSTGSCCTYKMETLLSTHTKELFQRNSKELIGKLTNVLGTRAHKFNEIWSKGQAL